MTTFAGTLGVYGYTNATGTAASFSAPMGIAVDSSGNIYVADYTDDLIRKITTGGQVTTFAGQAGVQGSVDGIGTAAVFYEPTGVAVDSSGYVYVADWLNSTIRKITPGGAVTTLAGQAFPAPLGAANGTGTAASFSRPYGVAVDNNGNVYVADTGNGLIREITPGGVVSTYAGGGPCCDVNGTGTAASFTMPFAITADTLGNVYVSDAADNLIRKITPGGVVSTLAGTGQRGSADGNGSTATFYQPEGIAVDTCGNVYVADSTNNMIREITPGGQVTTLAGTVSPGFANGRGTAALFDWPVGIGIGPTGVIYVGDTGNVLIRQIQ